MEKKRFAVLLCVEDSDYVKRMYGGYFNVFISLLEEEGEAWDPYRVVAGEFPSDEDLDHYDGFVVTGSRYDAHSDEDWICRLLQLLRRLHSMEKKVLGICFGHQILARALGGETGRANKGWDVGITCIHPVQTNNNNLRLPSDLPVISCHRDEVLELPPLAEVIASSEKTAVEMFRCGDHVMGIQGHPEYSKDIVLSFLEPMLQHNLIQTCEAEAVKASLAAGEPDREAWMRLCRGFLKGKL